VVIYVGAVVLGIYVAWKRVARVVAMGISVDVIIRGSRFRGSGMGPGISYMDGIVTGSLQWAERSGVS
jgi:hypothetical protein